MSDPVLIVETGAGVAGANTYTSMSESDAYHASMGNSEWADAVDSPDTARIVAKIRATRYLDNRYSTQWTGTRVGGRSQSLQWPRENAKDVSGTVIEDDEIPTEVKHAQFEAELRELLDPGSLSPDIVKTDRILREKVDVLEVQYADVDDADGPVPIITAIDDILAPLIGPRSGTKVSFVRRA